jgi:hypothetical protein
MGLCARPQTDACKQVQGNGFADFPAAVQAVWAGIPGGESSIALDDVRVLNVPVPFLLLSMGRGIGVHCRERVLRFGRDAACRQYSRDAGEATAGFNPGFCCSQACLMWLNIQNVA